MDINYLLLVPVLFPAACAILLTVCPTLKNRGAMDFFVPVSLALELVFTVLCAALAKDGLKILSLTSSLSLTLRPDRFGVVISVLVAVMWLMSGIFSHEYMEDEEHLTRYYAFFLLTEGALMALSFAANYLTMYLSFELMTLLSVPLVLHNGTDKARAAALKYLYYSIFGACLGLLGFFFMGHFGVSTEFVPGGTLDPVKAAGHEGALIAVTFLAVLGFGAKAGMFPLQAWLPTAHPEAPAGASALLSGIITKAGVLAILRVIYFVVGPDLIRGTWAQYALLGLALTTILLGSVLAYKEKVLKRRLAYSTVSQVSYVLFGLFLLEPTALLGAMLHVVCHAVIKNDLFLSAGAIIHKTGKTDVRELRGIGKSMPWVMWSFTIASLGLVGIPPLGGFVSKWYLSQGSLMSGIPVISWLGPAVLIVSALFTAGYLFSITIKGFFPGEDFDYGSLDSREPTWYMRAPLVILAALTVIIGIYPTPVIEFIGPAVSALF